MRIIRHKALEDITAGDVLEMLADKKIPEGISMNVTGDTVVVEPEDFCNLLGEIDDDYETIYFEED